MIIIIKLVKGCFWRLELRSRRIL